LDCWENFDDSSIRFTDNSGEKTKLVVKMLDPAVLSGPIFAEIHSGILMSGTLYPPMMYAELLGMSKDNTVYGIYNSPFPEENRLVTIDDSVTTAFKHRNMDMYYKIAVSIHEVLSCIPGNAAVFFTSYDFLNSIKALMEQNPLPKKVLVESRELKPSDKTALYMALQESRNSAKGSVLLGVMGGSMAEGVDYPDGLLDCIIVVGLPLAPPSLELDALNRYYSKKFDTDKSDDYCSILPAMNKVLQAAGRSIRSSSDRSVIVFMDSRFKMNKYRTYFPDDYNITGAEDFKTICNDFFSKSV
jgi:DNA excision repair protein ERCC-2